MKGFRLALLLASVAVLAGCAGAPQLPVQLKAESLAEPVGQVGVLVNVVDKPDTYFPGAGCLLCLAAASVANGKLTTHAGGLSKKELLALGNDVKAALERKHVQAVVLPETLVVDDLPKASVSGPNKAKRDFSSLKASRGVDKVLVVQINQLGFERNYTAYVPSGAPHASVVGLAYLVNVRTGDYEWYQPIQVSQGADGEWDEPPAFPRLTNAYFSAVELARDQVLEPFSK